MQHIEIPAWIPITDENDPSLNEVQIALCLDGVVQQVLGVPLQTLSLLLENPTVIQCGKLAKPGMTIQQAQESE
jgi:hypothetical protein